MLLYSFTITPNNRKVEAFIRHFDLDVPVHHVNFRERETQSDEYYRINPMRKVPALVDGDLKLWESNAILTYLAGKFPEIDALPTDLVGRADADRWLHWQSCHLMPAMGQLKVSDEKDFEAINPLLKILDEHLADRQYMLGGKLSVVDFAVAAYLLTKLGKKLDYDSNPNVGEWRARMDALKGFRETDLTAKAA